MRDEQFELHARIEDIHWWFRGRRTILKRVIRQVFPPSKGGTVVDVGCGTGANLAALAPQYDCLGIDVAEHAIEFARRRFPAVRFELADLHQLTDRHDDKPRLWLLLDVLEHVEDDLGFFATLVSAMKEDDQALLTVPADMSLWSPHDDNHGHYRRYDRAMLERLRQGHDVRPVFTSYFNFFLFPVIYAVRAYNRRRKKEWGEAGTDLDLPGPCLNRMLESIFASEGAVLSYLLKRGRRSGLPCGVSLMALLRKGTEERKCVLP